jgi:hypothetical protein
MRSSILAAMCLAATVGCVVDKPDEAAPAGAAGTAPAPAPAPPPPPELRLEVDVAARQVRVFRKEQLVKSYGVAVGRPEWPTQNGSWTVTDVIWNPGWTPPPDEEWTKDEEPKDPGAPDNPLGRVQMAYDPPRTIHGTNEPESIGTAASHGSIRMRNEDAVELAKMVMEAGGAPRDSSFFADVEKNRTRRVQIPLPNPIPISVINGAANADAVEGERDGSSGQNDSPDGTTAAPTPEPRTRTTPRAERSKSAGAAAADTARADTTHQH